MRTYFDQISLHKIAQLARYNTPEDNAGVAAFHSRHNALVSATEATLASIRSRGEYIMINGRWHHRRPYLA